MAFTNKPTATGLLERDFRAIKAFLVRSTVPLVYESDGVAGIQGSGCLFEFDSILYFVTAGHVLEGVDSDKLGVPLRQLDSEVFTLGSGRVGWSRNDAFDVAAYRIDDEQTSTSLRQSYSVLNASNVQATDPANNHYVVVGYPAETVSQVGMTLTPRDLTQIHASLYEGEILGTSTEYDFFLKLKSNAHGLWWQTTEVPNIHGISGGPVWQVKQSTSQVWTPESVLRLLGIQVACDEKRERYMRALSWAVVQEVLKELAPKSSFLSTSSGA